MYQRCIKQIFFQASQDFKNYKYVSKMYQTSISQPKQVLLKLQVCV
jgi:hypothetical protein